MGKDAVKMLVVAGIIFRDGRVLVAERKDDCVREPGRWEFPGGKVEVGESREEALKREIREELGMEISLGRRFAGSSVSYRDSWVRLEAYICRWESGEPRAIDVKDFRWAGKEDLAGFDWARADLPIAGRLISSWGEVIERG
ncbi:MAG: (deoxy)nucleoside triphosphate pyrophosphohydrolase [Candidatus Micrarchaeia archaeon]